MINELFNLDTTLLEKFHTVLHEVNEGLQDGKSFHETYMTNEAFQRLVPLEQMVFQALIKQYKTKK